MVRRQACPRWVASSSYTTSTARTVPCSPGSWQLRHPQRTPTTLGTYAIQVTVQDSTGASVTKSYNVSVQT